MSEQGWILDEFSLEIRQTNDQKVSFCGERPRELNFIDFRGPRSSAEEVLDAYGGGRSIQTEPGRVRQRVREAPGQAYKS